MGRKLITHIFEKLINIYEYKNANKKCLLCVFYLKTYQQIKSPQIHTNNFSSQGLAMSWLYEEWTQISQKQKCSKTEENEDETVMVKISNEWV